MNLSSKMANTYWYKQEKDPLFEDLAWSKPENKFHAGKLLIIGGSSHGFNEPAEAFAAANEAGIGVVKVLLPDIVKSLMPKETIESIEFIPSLKNGGFASTSVAEMLDNANWADAVLLAGGVGRNSETAITLESFIKAYKDKLTITQDALDMFLANPEVLLNRSETLIVASFGQLQKLLQNFKQTSAITSSMTLLNFVENLHNLTELIPAKIMTSHQRIILVADNGKVSSTKNNDDVWRVKLAAKAAVLWLQNPSKSFEAITTSLV